MLQSNFSKRWTSPHFRERFWVSIRRIKLWIQRFEQRRYFVLERVFIGKKSKAILEKENKQGIFDWNLTDSKKSFTLQVQWPQWGHNFCIGTWYSFWDNYRSIGQLDLLLGILDSSQQLWKVLDGGNLNFSRRGFTNRNWSEVSFLQTSYLSLGRKPKEPNIVLIVLGLRVHE